jgi:hypothetical protein
MIEGTFKSSSKLALNLKFKSWICLCSAMGVRISKAEGNLQGNLISILLLSESQDLGCARRKKNC